MEEKGIFNNMLKIVVFDSGYGGEFFADYLERELPIVEIVRVIDWRHANQIQNDPKAARQLAKEALRPYIGKVDLIIFANFLLAATSLKHFKRKYKNQNFIGLKLPSLNSSHPTFILTTKSLTKTINYYNYIFRIKCKTKTIILDTWPSKIDDGELTHNEISQTLSTQIKEYPSNIILACSQFYDIKGELKQILGKKVTIYDGFQNTFKETCKILKIRGASFKKVR